MKVAGEGVLAQPPALLVAGVTVSSTAFIGGWLLPGDGDWAMTIDSPGAQKFRFFESLLPASSSVTRVIAANSTLK